MEDELLSKFKRDLYGAIPVLTHFCKTRINDLSQILKETAQCSANHAKAAQYYYPVESELKSHAGNLFSLFCCEMEKFGEKMSPDSLNSHFTRLDTLFKKAFKAQCNLAMLETFHQLFHEFVPQTSEHQINFLGDFLKLAESEIEMARWKMDAGEILMVYNTMLKDMHNIIDNFESNGTYSNLYTPQEFNDLMSSIRFHLATLTQYNSAIYYHLSTRMDQKEFQKNVLKMASGLNSLVKNMLIKVSCPQSCSKFMEFLLKVHQDMDMLFVSTVPGAQPYEHSPNKNLSF